jgi:predicted N-formylglutamate amidohydrolase
LCGVALVPEERRGRPLDQKERNERIEMIWRGSDPVAVSQAVAALNEAGIRHHVKATHDHLVFGLAMPRPKYELRVFASDAAQAKELLAGIQDTAPFATEEVARQEETTAAPEAESEAIKHAAAEWKPAQATIEVWSGEDAALAQVLEDCLRENGIDVRRAGIEPGTLRFFVMPPDADAAREIVREVREGTPPV